METELLREFFHYCPDTGVVTWKKNKPPRGRAGEPAGYLTKANYWATTFQGKLLYLHRLIWQLQTGTEAPEEVMFRDGDSDNLRWSNLALRSQLTPIGPLTVGRLREVLSYNPETGDFKWQTVLGKSRAGDKPGCWAERAGGLRRLVIQVDGKRFEATHLAFALQTGEFPPKRRWVDHKDGDPANNRWENLRLACARENAGNQGNKPPRAEGLPRGVEEFKRANGPSDFGFAVMHAGKRHRQRGFETAEAAHEAYKALHRHLHGEFSVYASRTQKETPP